LKARVANFGKGGGKSDSVITSGCWGIRVSRLVMPNPDIIE